MSEEEYNLEFIVGEKLSAVVFVLDYYQFQFDGPMFTVLTPVTVVDGLDRARTGEERFCNLLRGRIAKIVRQVEVKLHDQISIIFDDGSSIHFSLKVEDYPGPEAVILDGAGRGLWVF